MKLHIHHWIRMPEPNKIGVSVRICCCGAIEKFNPHGFNLFPFPSSGHWMRGLEWFGKFEEQIVKEFYMEHCLNYPVEWVKKAEKKNSYELEILGETTEEWITLDIEMDDDLIQFLVDYAKQNLDQKEGNQLLVNWAFNDILKKQIEKGETKKSD